LIAGLKFDKSMRWNRSNVQFSRPIRWLLALLGEQVVPFEYAGLDAGRITRGLRFYEPAEFSVKTPTDYFQHLKEQGILLDGEERRQAVAGQVRALAEDAKGATPEDPALLSEVTNLIEAPTALLGSFDPSHLKLPREVLISVMKKHQRYFPVEERAAAAENNAQPLLPYFIAVRNGDRQGLDLVTEGNEHVIRARFTDAAYFVREDLKQPLEAYLPKLARLTFQFKLGSMLDKSRRIEALVDDLAAGLGLNASQKALALRAAQLCKADLATHMVVEMTSLQGTMGRYYALDSGEPEGVALAIFEHYLPRYAGDLTPRTRPGLAVGTADRLDSLVGLFAAGLAPTGNKDPFAQRRAALGLVQNLIAWKQDFDLRPALQAAAAHLPVDAGPQVQAATLDFIIERMRNGFLDQGWRYDVVDAVVQAQGYNPARAARGVQELTEWVNRPDWGSILPTYARCVRITRDLEAVYPVEKQALAEPAESDLYAALLEAESAQREPGSVSDFLNAFLPMMPAINRFFDEVLVMAEDARLRENRLGMLQRIAALAAGAADLSRLEGF
jgi:glycyl-tRNA synthetase